MNIFSKIGRALFLTPATLVNKGIKKIDSFLESFFTDILNFKREFDKKDRERYDSAFSLSSRITSGYKETNKSKEIVQNKNRDSGKNAFNFLNINISTRKNKEPNKKKEIQYSSKQLPQAELYDHKKLNKHAAWGNPQKVTNSRYIVERNGNAFIAIEDKNHYENNDYSETGWKFHINMDKNDFKNAWEEISKILLDEKSGVIASKVINRNYGFCLDNKQITIYVHENKKTKKLEKTVDEYKSLLGKIENILTRLKIKSTKKPPLDRAILNSDYITYRNEKNKDGKYVPNESTKENENLTEEAGDNYNPGGYPDPFENMKLNCEQIESSKLNMFPQNNSRNIPSSSCDNGNQPS